MGLERLSPADALGRELLQLLALVKVGLVVVALAGLWLAWPWLTAPPSTYGADAAHD